MLKITTFYYRNLASNTIQLSLNQCLLGTAGSHVSVIKHLKLCVDIITKVKTISNSQFQSTDIFIIKMSRKAGTLHSTTRKLL